MDPAARRKAAWRRFWCWLIGILAIAGLGLYFTDNLKCIGLPFHKEKPVEEVVDEGAAAAEEAVETTADTVSAEEVTEG